MHLGSAMVRTHTVAYDANGNTLSDPSDKSYSWDFENRLTQVVNPGVGTTTFRYDPFGRRIQKSGPLGTTNYLYDGVNDIEEMDSTGNILGRYTRTESVDETLSESRSGTTSYYQRDGLGSVTSLSSSAGALANTYTYDSYGRLTSSTGTLVNPFQYTGRELDPETGIYYYRARYFDPSEGRFLSEDPIRLRGGVNFYAYTRNRSVLLTDPSGHQGGCPPQSPNCVPTDPDAPYQGPDGLWYNTLDWNGQTDPAPSVPDNGPPAPPSSPASPCPCSHDATYYAVVADVQSEYDWERVKILGKMVGFSWGIDGIEHQVPEQWGHWLPGLDLILWGRDISELLELQRKAHEEIEKRLGCTD